MRVCLIQLVPYWSLVGTVPAHKASGQGRGEVGQRRKWANLKADPSIQLYAQKSSSFYNHSIHPLLPRESNASCFVLIHKPVYISPVLSSNVGSNHTYAISHAKSPQFDLSVAVLSLVAMGMLIKAKRQLALTFTLIVPDNVYF